MDLLALTFLAGSTTALVINGDLECCVSRLPARVVPSLGPLRRTQRERAGISAAVKLKSQSLLDLFWRKPSSEKGFS